MLSDKGVTVKRVLNAPRARVFEALTRPDLMARWFFPGNAWTTVANVELRIGGRYEVSMRDTEGVQHLQFGVYREIVPESRLVFTWTCPELGVDDSIVTVELMDLGSHTELVLFHELPPDPKIRRGHQGGWEGCLGNLDKLLSSNS
jgi:uncharacterized protein YndB with AHSA1/START domain